MNRQYGSTGENVWTGQARESSGGRGPGFLVLLLLVAAVIAVVVL